MANRSVQLAAAGAELARRNEQRATDDDRERCATHIRYAYELGALTPDELEDRLTAAFNARTRGDLVKLTRDLPRDGSRGDAWRRAALRWHAATYTATNGGLVGIWAMTGGGVFWPAGSIGGWGAFVALHAYAYRKRMQRRRKRRTR